MSTTKGVTKGTATKQRILEATSQLLERQGYAATGMKDIVEAGMAPSGSVYHFFPGGKEQLGVEALRYFGELVCAEITALRHVPDIPAAMEIYFTRRARMMEDADWEPGCALAAGTLESTNDQIGRACADAFVDIRDALTSAFTDAGIEGDEAEQLAIFVLSSFEGASVLTKAFRSTEPLENAGRFVAAALREHLPAAS
jgi:TetR/AcrR family transcriptional regulator, lmrAB and yxaGH operons repressor